MPSRHIRLLFSSSAKHRHLSSSSNHSDRKSLTIPIVASALGIVVVLFLLFLLWYRKRLKQRSNKTSPDDGAAFNLQKFKYRQLKRATKSFSQAQKLGKGGFGIVYRGVLRNGKEVAVKKLELSSLQGEREFQNELSICGGLNSPYVVSLLGYCTHGKTVRLLVYECMQNRSLQEALFEKGYPVHLDWEKRLKIIFDTAKALEFLHLECSPPVIHGDVKPSNILLDSQFSARIADFGLARLKTEDFWMDSARVSISSDRFRSETPDRFRIGSPERFKLGTPDRFSNGTPEMSRSSTKNALSELSVKSFAEVVSEKKMAKDKSFIVDISATKALRDIHVADCDSVRCSPNNSSVVRSENLPEELTETEKSTAAHEGLSGHVEHENHDTKVTVLVQKDPLASGTEDSDGFSKVCPSEGCTTDDVVNSEGPKDVRLLTLNREGPQEKISSGKDWWWKQDISGDLSGRDYVMDWISSELRVSRQNGSFKNEEIVPADENSVGAKAGRSRFRPLDANGEQSGEITYTEANKKDRKAKSKHRKSREWWKDEYFAELNSKNKSFRSGKLRTEKEININSPKDSQSGDLSGYVGEKLQSQSKRRSRDYRSGDLSLCRGKERRAKMGSDKWSGDLRNRQFSGDLLNRQWSGDLSKSGELVSRDVSSTTSMRGTVCYVAPEYGGSGVLSERSDIYSFGVLMLVILSGRRPIQVTTSPMKEFERANLISWARSLSQSGKLLDLVDESLHGQYDPENAILCITLALLCLQRVPARRPTISDVVKILSGEIVVPSLPLELSPSPPAKKSHRSPLRPPKDNPLQLETS